MTMLYTNKICIIIRDVIRGCIVFFLSYSHWVEMYTGYWSKMSRCLHLIRKKTHNEGKEIRNFSYLILFSVLGVCQFRIAICIFSKVYA